MSIYELNDKTDSEGVAAPAELMQACSNCKTEHPVSHFQRATPGGRWFRCAECRQPERRLEKRTPATAETVRRSNLRRLYGITPEEYDARRERQGFRCAVCRRHEDELEGRQTGRPRHDGKPNTPAMKLHVDHDHDTNAIRGLLCYNCNMGLGAFRDRADWMTAAISYLTDGDNQ